MQWCKEFARMNWYNETMLPFILSVLYELNRCKMEVTMFARLATALTKRTKKNAQKLMQEKRSNQIFFQNDVPKTKQSSSISHFLDIFFCLKINFGNKRADSIKLFYWTLLKNRINKKIARWAQWHNGYSSRLLTSEICSSNPNIGNSLTFINS